jgi:hypothetical protein
MLEGINYWDAVRESPSHLEICFAIFANFLKLDDHGDPVNEKHAERRAATSSTWRLIHCSFPYCAKKKSPDTAASMLSNLSIGQR